MLLLSVPVMEDSCVCECVCVCVCKRVHAHMCETYCAHELCPEAGVSLHASTLLLCAPWYCRVMVCD